MTTPDNSYHRLVRIVRSSRRLRRLYLLSADIVLVFCAYYLAYWLRLDAMGSMDDWGGFSALFWRSVGVLVAIRVFCHWFTRQYNWSFSYAGLQEAGGLFFSITLGSLFFVLINYQFEPFGLKPPRSVYVLEGCLSFLATGGIRFLPKYLYSMYCEKVPHWGNKDETRNTLIYGAGGMGELLARELLRTKGHSCRVAGFIDDSEAKQGVTIHGRKVLGKVADLPKIIKNHQIEEILIAIPEFSGAPLRYLMEICSPFNISYKIIPPYQSVLAQKINVLTSLEKLKPEALINRPAIPFDGKRLADFYCGRSALVTGAAGSIGSEICRQLSAFGINTLILFDIYENGLFFLYNELKEKYPELSIAFEVGSVQDHAFVREVMNAYRPNVVLHAAAYKHVTMMESCPSQALKNNVAGTYNVHRAAREAGAEHFLLISTDKAVAPASIMGATKRLAESVINNADHGRMRPTIVRFGNVLGSNGSLLQIIQKQIQKGGPVTVTDPKMTRFFMTISEAIGLVLLTPTLDHPGDGCTFILNMGDAVSIDKFIRHVISLSGLVPERDIDIVYINKRPGEKLVERLTEESEGLEETIHEGVKAVRHNPASLDPEALALEIYSLDGPQAKAGALALIKKHVATYQSAP